MQRYITRHDSI